MFAYRHRTTRDDLTAQGRDRDQGLWRVAVSGSHGMIGGALVPLLTAAGHGVTRLVRHAAADGEVAWSPTSEHFDATALDGLDGVVHLAASNIAAGRWTASRKQLLRDSRVRATRVLSEGLARMARPPKVLVAASAIGWYGDRGAELLDEHSSAGEGFLAELAQDWESATRPAVEAGIRVVSVRFGVVLSPQAGSAAKDAPGVQMGPGWPIGQRPSILELDFPG